MNYKRNRRILLFSLISIIALLCFYIFQTPSAHKARKNVENVKKIKIGMKKEDVLTIMGEPDNRRISFLNSIDSMYYFEPPFGASEGIYIQFDSNNAVNKIIDYE